VLANAYFLPGRASARRPVRCRPRGVRVTLLLQGRVEYPCSTTPPRPSTAAAGCRHAHLRIPPQLPARQGRGGRRLWATVGSSNIDPFSLLLAREANVVASWLAYGLVRMMVGLAGYGGKH
jgi:cardiolipin synthase